MTTQSDRTVPAGRPASTADKIHELRARKASAAQPSSPLMARRQRALGKLTARQRILMLLDPDSFLELDTLATQRSQAFGADPDSPPGDGVIVGFGTVDGRQIGVYAQDVMCLHGSVGEVFGEKVGKLLDLAVRTGCPVVSLNDSSGARLQEGILALAAYGRVASRVVNASGVIPQISLIMGVCAGGAVYTPALTDFIVMVERTSHMFVTGPDVVRTVTGERIGMEALGGARLHGSRTGNVHYVASDEEDAIAFVRELLSYLPSNNLELPPRRPAQPSQDCSFLNTVVPDTATSVYDMHRVLDGLLDDGELLEMQAGFARNMICGFGRIEGAPVGVVANQPMQLAGALDIDASEKAARFIRFCDAFNLPIITVVDVPGFLPGTAQEHNGIIRRGAKLGFAYIESTVPKITVIVRKAFGGGYAVMGSRGLGADFCFAWPTAEIGIMGAAGAVGLLFQDELALAADPVALAEELAQTYAQSMTSPYLAASRGCVDEVIEPADTRAVLIKALRILRDKRVESIPRKHSNIPL